MRPGKDQSESAKEAAIPLLVLVLRQSDQGRRQIKAPGVGQGCQAAANATAPTSRGRPTQARAGQIALPP
jgi:hypothetical protein